jgi:hypothetical protein
MMIKTHLCFTSTHRKLVLSALITVLGTALLQAAWIDRTDRGGTVTASSQIHEGESKEMAFDNTTSTKWLTGFTPTGWIQFQFPNNQQNTITRYSIASANDVPERDPRNWTLDGSNDGSSWTVVDTQVDQSWSARFQRREFACSNPNAYNYYRLTITLNNGASNLTGFSEMELLEDVFLTHTPSPPDKAEDVATDGLVLSWEAPADVADPEYAIYLDTALLPVQQADPSVRRSLQVETSFPVDSLDSFTTYYWRVDVINGGSIGDVWRFRTQLPDIRCLSIVTDINEDCQVNLPDLVIIASQWLDTSCPPDFCADMDDSSQVDMADFAAVAQDWNVTAETMVLHEVMADNETVLMDNFGEYSDWIELRNLGNTPQNLQGWFLTDSPSRLNQWAFPAVTIGPKDYLVVFASGRNLASDPVWLHTNFKLSKDGEYLALVRPDRTIAHQFSPAFLPLGNDEAYGLTVLPGEDTFVASLLAAATPGRANEAAVVWEKPQFSQPSGICDAAFTLELSVPEPDMEIRYTLNGSCPTSASALYTEPLTISKSTCIRAAAFKEKYLPGKTQTRTYIFLSDVISQPALPDGWPSVWKATAADYEMDPDIVNHPVYGPQVFDSLRSLPILSIVTDSNNLFDSATGIYANPLEEGVEWERPASVELLTTANQQAFQLDCGLRIQGGAFRRFDLTRKKSFRLVFKQEYGAGKLNYPLFDYDSNAAESFDTITLRAGANDGYSWVTAYGTEQYIRDEFGRGVQRASGNAGSHGTFVHLYLNGLYWGLYNAVERPDNAFSATYYGGEKEDWDAINSGDVSEGDLTAWNTLQNKCRAGMTTLAAYQEIQGRNPDGSRNPAYPVLIDMANYIDYITINMWGGNGDWPHRNYWLCRLRTDDSEGFKFYCWDYEGTIASPFAQENKVTADFNTGAGVPHYYLKENAEYRMLFADRVHRLFFNGGPLTTGQVMQRYMQLADWVEPSIIAESARWGDMHHHPPLGLSEWIAKRDDILNNYLPPRSGVVLNQLRNAGFYPQLNAPVFYINGSYQHGGLISAGDVFTMASPDGASVPMLYTTDGSDPRLPGGAVNPSAIAHTGPFTLTQTGPVKARALNNGQWSALNEAVYAAGF